MEAVIALYLDGGYHRTRDFVLRTFAETIEAAVQGKLFSDYKSEIQEVLKKEDAAVSSHTRLTGKKDQTTTRLFVHLSCDGKVLGEGSGKSKKEAEQNAAKAALDTLKRSGKVM